MEHFLALSKAIEEGNKSAREMMDKIPSANGIDLTKLRLTYNAFSAMYNDYNARFYISDDIRDAFDRMFIRISDSIKSSSKYEEWFFWHLENFSKNGIRKFGSIVNTYHGEQDSRFIHKCTAALKKSPWYLPLEYGIEISTTDSGIGKDISKAADLSETRAYFYNELSVIDMKKTENIAEFIGHFISDSMSKEDMEDMHNLIYRECRMVSSGAYFTINKLKPSKTTMTNADLVAKTLIETHSAQATNAWAEAYIATSVFLMHGDAISIQNESAMIPLKYLKNHQEYISDLASQQMAGAYPSSKKLKD